MSKELNNYYKLFTFWPEIHALSRFRRVFDFGPLFGPFSVAFCLLFFDQHGRLSPSRSAQSPCGSARSRSVRSRRGCCPKNAGMPRSRVAAPSRTLATRMPSEECVPRSRVLSCKLRFDAAEPRALDGPSLARRRTPSPLIPSPIYGIIYEFSDFWAQFWTIFKSTRPPSKS